MKSQRLKNVKRLAWMAPVLAVTAASSQAGPTCLDAGGIPGRDLQLILVALPEFTRQHLDLSKYRVTVGNRDGSPEVNFESLSATPANIRGNMTGIPEFTVQLTPNGQQVQRVIHWR